MKFYITTPIYYVNDLPHLGHVYTNVAADTLARYKRLSGFDVFFLTGTDEHGQKMERQAAKEGIRPQELADRVVVKFKELWKRLDISNDDFIRTTESRHIQGATKLFEKIYRGGGINKGRYQGWYCTPCESYWSEREFDKDQECPSCRRPCEWVEEESYFFRMSTYQEKILRYIEEDPAFIQPGSRRTEILNLIKEGLRDLSISRSSFSWGIPVPIDPKGGVIYVWFEALINYLTGCGFGADDERFERYWPADIQIIGKDILRFHAIIWPTMLMAAGLSPPKKIFAHGWWMVKGRKMSKSLGNMVNPHQLIDEFGQDALRYFLLREVPFGLDGDFSKEALINRINADLANDLGNLVSRILGMLQLYTDSKIPHPRGSEDGFQDIFLKIPMEVNGFMEELVFNQVLIRIWDLVHSTNEYIDQKAPWRLERDDPYLSTILYTLSETLRYIALLIFPFMPNTARKMWDQLGIEESIENQGLTSLTRWGVIKPGTRTVRGEPLFPRIG
ncbi:TPA: methionine--tRNA ligase [bacterium]|nr:methionine--tRNA ligase [bacterium]